MANCNSNFHQKRSSQLAFSLASNRDIMKRSISCSNNNKNNRNRNRNRDHNHCLHIPGNVILEILLRLPVKSLVRFKCVCKSWFSLISDPHFAESHFNQALTPPSHRLLYIIPPLSSSAFKSYSIGIDSSLHHHHIIPLPNIINKCDLSKIRFQGSCRGFVLLDNYPSRNLFLWNPSTGAHRTLPYPPIVVFDSFMLHGSSLVYDVATDDYLVLMICITFGVSTVTFCMEIFSVRTNSWEEILFQCEPNVGPTNLLVSGLFLNGAVHWRLTRRVILCFDLKSKKFSEVDVPNAFCHSLSETHLIVLGGCLAMCNRKEIWVMKEYKVHSSWTKFSDLYNDKVSVVHINRFGEVIGLRDRSSERGITVVKLNDKGEELESREFSDLSFEVTEAFYMESLFSLPEKPRRMFLKQLR